MVIGRGFQAAPEQFVSAGRLIRQIVFSQLGEKGDHLLPFSPHSVQRVKCSPLSDDTI